MRSVIEAMSVRLCCGKLVTMACLPASSRDKSIRWRSSAASWNYGASGSCRFWKDQHEELKSAHTFFSLATWNPSVPWRWASKTTQMLKFLNIWDLLARRNVGRFRKKLGIIFVLHILWISCLIMLIWVFFFLIILPAHEIQQSHAICGSFRRIGRLGPFSWIRWLPSTIILMGKGRSFCERVGKQNVIYSWEDRECQALQYPGVALYYGMANILQNK